MKGWLFTQDQHSYQRPIVDIGLCRQACRSAGVTAVRERPPQPLRVDDLFVTARDLSADDDE